MNWIKYYVEGRLLEWTNSLAFAVLGLFIFIWPKTITNPSFHLFAWILPTPFIGLVLLISSTICIVALITNGNSTAIGPRARAWTAVVRAILLLQFGISTLQSSWGQGFPFTVVPFWFLMAVAELWNAYRAVLDVRTHR